MATISGRPLGAVPARPARTSKHACHPMRAGLGTARSGATLDTTQPHRDVSRAVARAKQGDEEAFCLLYHRFADGVYRHAWRLLRDSYEAEDVTQAVFTKLLTCIGQYEDRGLSFAAWLMRIAHNQAIDQLRRRREAPYEEVRLAGAAVDDSAAERRSSLAAALRAVPDDQRNVVVLRHLVGLSPAEIAARMGRSEGSVHGLHHRGRRALRRALTDLDAAPTTLAA